MSLFTSLHGRRLGIGKDNELVSNGVQISRPCVDASVTVSAEGATVANQRDITIVLKDAQGDTIDYVETFELIVFGAADKTSFSAGGSTGLANGTDGQLVALVAKKVFLATSEVTGLADFIYTDIGTAAAFLGLRLPNGRIVMGDQAMTNA